MVHTDVDDRVVERRALHRRDTPGVVPSDTREYRPDGRALSAAGNVDRRGVVHLAPRRDGSAPPFAEARAPLALREELGVRTE